MATSELAVRFEGAGVASGSIDVRDLAPTMLALADVFQEANKIANPGAPDVSLHVKAHERGSFHVSLDLATPVALLSSDPATALANLKALVIDPVLGLVGYLRHRAHHPDDQGMPTEDGGITFELATGAKVTYPPQTVAAGSNLVIRHSLRKITDTIDEEVIEKVSVSSDGIAEPLVLDHDDVGVLGVVGGGEEDVVVDSTTRMMLLVVSPNLDSPEKSWRFKLGGQSLWARITDAAFLARVRERRDAFSSQDYLDADLRIVQRRVDGEIVTTHEITRVHGHTGETVEQHSLDI